MVPMPVLLEEYVMFIIMEWFVTWNSSVILMLADPLVARASEMASSTSSRLMPSLLTQASSAITVTKSSVLVGRLGRPVMPGMPEKSLLDMDMMWSVRLDRARVELAIETTNMAMVANIMLFPLLILRVCNVVTSILTSVLTSSQLRSKRISGKGPQP